MPRACQAARLSQQISGGRAQRQRPGDGLELPPIHPDDELLGAVDHTIDVGVFFALGEPGFFPEYYANPAAWTGPGQGATYAVNHALNCTNKDQAFGYSTYWFDAATTQPQLSVDEMWVDIFHLKLGDTLTLRVGELALELRDPAIGLLDALERLLAL